MLLSRIADQLGLTLRGEDRDVHGLNTLEAAGPDELSFLANPKYLPQLASTRAGAVIVEAGHADKVTTALISATPYADFGRALAFFIRPDFVPEFPNGVSEQAYVHPEAEVAPTACLFPFAFVGPRARIGRGCRLYPGCYVGEDCVVGENTVLYPNVSLMARTEVGARCILHAGVVLGADGFGFSRQDGGIQKIPQIGRVRVGDDVEIGANTTVDRAVLGTTVVDSHTKIDNLVQIGHNVHVGKRGLLVAQAGIAGSTHIGDDVTIAGHAGIAGHVKIGNRVTVGPLTGVPRDIPEGTTVGGIPAMESRTFLRWLSAMPKVPDMLKRLNALEKELDRLKVEKTAHAPDNEDMT